MYHFIKVACGNESLLFVGVSERMNQAYANGEKVAERDSVI